MLPNVKHQKIIYYLLAVLSGALFIYIALKANATSFTHDESFTYLSYVHEPFMDIISYKRAYTNNHILNTVLIKYSESFFGSSELALRLPNVLACALYMIFGFKIIKKITPLLLIPCFLCLMLNTQLLDFFSLARGYGLSFAFMLMSLFHLISYFNTLQQKNLIMFNVAAFFAVFSNFSLINFYIAAVFTYNAFTIITLGLNISSIKSDFKFFKLNRIHLCSLPIFIAFLYEPIRRISKRGMLDFGGKTGFLEDTFGSLIRGVFYETTTPPFAFVFLQLLFVCLLLLIGVLIIKKVYAKQTVFFDDHKSLVIAYIVLISIIALSFIQHLLIDNDFYSGRFALFIYPLLILNFIFYMNYLYQQKLKFIPLIIVYVLSTLLVINFFANINLRFYQEWKFDASTKTVMEILTKEHENHPEKATLKLGVNWLFEPTTNFYRYTHNLNWLKKTNRKGLTAKDDYYYLFKADTNAYLANGKPVLFLMPLVNSTLVKNK